MKKILFNTLLITIAVLVLLVADVNAQVQEAIDFSAVDMNGKKINLSDYNDKVVILDFWATWCGPCRREIPNLIDIKNTYKNKDFEIISIALERGSEEKVIQFVKNNNMNWVHIVDKETAGQLAQKYGIRYIPSMFIIKDGKVVATGLRGQQLKDKINQLI